MPIALLLGLVLGQDQPQTVQVSLVRSGITQNVGGFTGRTLNLTSIKPAGITNLPTGLTKPLFGTLKLSGARFYVVLAFKGTVQKLFVDSNSNGNLQDDAPANWYPKTSNRSASGNAEIRIPFSGHRASCNVIFVQTGPKALEVLPDYGFGGQLQLGPKKMAFVLLDGSGSGFVDGSPKGGVLAFDRLHTGQIVSAAERYKADQPFTLGGSSYVLNKVSLDSATVTFMPGEKVAEIPMPVPQIIGTTVPSFSSKTIDGKAIEFPSGFKNRIVLLYVWASWSAPSLEWLPRIKKLYDADKSHGLDVLGICLDRAREADAAKSSAIQMPWPTLFDGKTWRGPAPAALQVNALPYLVLVDGSTGKILATMNDMIGENLEKNVGAALHG